MSLRSTITERLGPWLPTIGLAAAALVVLAVVLHLMGRVAWYEGGFGFWTSSAHSRRTSQDLFDPYTLTHVLHGFIFYAALWPFRQRLSVQWRFSIALAVEIAWEIVENTPWIIDRYRVETAALEYYGDSIVNSLGDALAAAAGFLVAMRLPWKATAALAAIEEFVLLAAIRDNLTLNVVMLLFPIEGIKTWQAGG